MVSEHNLHRWLRARGWDVERAYRALIKHAAWRIENMPSGKVDPASIANELACEKAYLQDCDRKGRPIMIIQVRAKTSAHHPLLTARYKPLKTARVARPLSWHCDGIRRRTVRDLACCKAPCRTV